MPKQCYCVKPHQKAESTASVLAPSAYSNQCAAE